MPTFIRLVDYNSAEEKERGLQDRINKFEFKQRRFINIPGSPLAYWVPEVSLHHFSRTLSQDFEARQGFLTTDNDQYIRWWYELSHSDIGFCCYSIEESVQSGKKWFPFNKGGGFRKWFGIIGEVVNWENNGAGIKADVNKKYPYLKGNIGLVVKETNPYFRKNGITWSDISSKSFGARYMPKGFLFEKGVSCLFDKKANIDYVTTLAYLNSKVASYYLNVMNPTFHYQVGDVISLPSIENDKVSINLVKRILSFTKADWDLRETSWDYRRNALLSSFSSLPNSIQVDENLVNLSWPSAFSEEQTIDLVSQANSFKCFWASVFHDLHMSEEELNHIFIELYDLKSEFTPTIPYTEITILQDELDENARKEGKVEFDDRVLALQFIYYGIGCLLGRYTVEKDGLILAEADATIDDFRTKIPNSRFLPNADGILPFTDEDDFPDDLPTAFKSWLRFISGANYDGNLRWIEEKLGKDLRSFFDRDFYKDHIKRYKSRPIYWMVSSPSGAFRALIYLHRYTKDTVGKILNDYVRPYRTKFDQKIRGLESVIDSGSSSAGEKTKAKKRLAQLEKYKVEIETWEKEKLYPLALKRVELDLDDGVKVNYRKLEGILEPVKQLEAKEED